MPKSSLSVDRPSQASSSIAGKIGRYRWVICALLFFAATINYIDRQVIGILKPTLQGEFGWSEIDYADIVFAFQLAYAIGFLLAGRMIDWLGTKRGFSVALIVWSLAAVAHAEATVFGPAAAHRAGVRGADLLGLCRRLHLRPARTRVRRGGQLPGGDQGDGGVVSEEGARARHGPLQLGHQRRRAADTARRAMDHPSLGLVLGVCHHRRARLHLAVLLDSAVRVARTSSPRRRRRAGAHPQRPARSAGAHPMGPAPEVSPDVGVRARQVPHRSGLVAVSLLDPGLSQQQPRDRSPHDRAAARRDLSDCRRRQHRRRLAVVGAAQARLERQCGSQDGDAGVRAGCRADDFRVGSRRACGWPSGW